MPFGRAREHYFVRSPVPFGKWAVSLPGEFRRRPPCRRRENADACKAGRRGGSSKGGETAPLAAPDLTKQC